MTEKILVQGNEAIGWGAINAGCCYFFGYPITPQNEITEWFARELPSRGGVFVQTQSELGSINMLYGAAAAGARAMTSTSGPGWALMQETMAHLTAAELPCVIVLVQRGGAPAAAGTRHAQTDYTSATRGGGHSGYKDIVLTPASVQESHDLMQLAFHLADKYRNPVIVMTDAIIGQMSEPLEVKPLDFGPLPDKDWALKGKGEHKDGKRRYVMSAHGVLAEPPFYMDWVGFAEHCDNKFKRIKSAEVMYETHQTEDAELVLVAYGYTARCSEEAIAQARAEGLKVGLIRPITVWPFPYDVIREKANQGCKFLVVEDSTGQMIEDVILGVEGKAPVHLLGIWARHMRTVAGMITPERVLEEIRKLMLGDCH